MAARQSDDRALDAALQFEGRTVPIAAGDTVASALYRAGVRVFSRSFKYHRPRGLYCLTGDCPNCMVNVDGEPWVRSCVREASPGQRVRRQAGWPSADRDVLGLADRMHRLMPVGFYYKTMLRPRWVWPAAEPWIRRFAGQGSIPETRPEHREARNLHPDLMVVGAGIAGLSAALAAAGSGRSVVICDEGRSGETLAPGPVRRRVAALLSEVASSPLITLLERTPAIGIYEGPLVVLNGHSFLHLVHPEAVVVATGAVEEHGVFPGNDLPGVWLGRGAARLAGVHNLLPGRRIVLVTQTTEAADHAAALRTAGADVLVVDGEVVAARGRESVRSVVVDRGAFREEIQCDALVLSLGLVPRDALALQAAGLPVVTIGDAASPGLDFGQVEEQGRHAGIGAEVAAGTQIELPRAARGGIVCLCEDVGVDELDQAWREGFRSSEILKRYTTATMGPCQGAMCHRHLRAFVASRPDATGPASGPTTARPPVRGITLEQAAAGVRDEIHQRTALHNRHLALGAIMEPSGVWRRPRHYGDKLAEYWAVRRGVSVMDVGTLGKFLVAGPDATEFLERLYPCRVSNLRPGRLRYALLLGEHGFVIDDGTICALGEDRWYLTFTSAGAATAEAVLKDWAETWSCEVHIVDLTAAWGAINLTGPHARELLQRLCADPLDNETFPYLHHREITVGGVPCRAIRLGFLGELSYELHHASNRSVELWDALLAAGRDLDIRPHGLDALRVLRLEKGHIIVGQDTDFDATPGKLHMSWAVRMEKPWFVGKQGIERANSHDPLRQLVAVSFPGRAPREGAPLRADGKLVGYLTSSAWSPVLERGVSLGWVSRVDGAFPTELESDGIAGHAVDQPFYDPQGERLRA
ncbi:MAG TPA: 2Fe-2S iron-sulfur cluster-binding protein [Chloroflexota bacterium]|nr:2Fe-2S iron-sulfur cluster-binding protein [Chloroflexota bacterium]